MTTTTLTTRPRYVAGQWEGYEPFAARWRETLSNLRPFWSASALRGVTNPDQIGRLYGLARDAFLAGRGVTITYAVYSYATPIAWYDTERGWVVPECKYSVTTTRHQSLVAMGLSHREVLAA